jgi:hypothetical protein
MLPPPARATTEDGLHRRNVQGRPCAVHHALEHLVQHTPFVEEQVAALLRLINRERLMKAAPLLLGHVQRQAPTDLGKLLRAG